MRTCRGMSRTGQGRAEQGRTGQRDGAHDVPNILSDSPASTDTEIRRGCRQRCRPARHEARRRGRATASPVAFQSGRPDAAGRCAPRPAPARGRVKPTHLTMPESAGSDAAPVAARAALARRSRDAPTPPPPRSCADAAIHAARPSMHASMPARPRLLRASSPCHGPGHGPAVRGAPLTNGPAGCGPRRRRRSVPSYSQSRRAFAGALLWKLRCLPYALHSRGHPLHKRSQVHTTTVAEYRCGGAPVLRTPAPTTAAAPLTPPRRRPPTALHPRSPPRSHVPPPSLPRRAPSSAPGARALRPTCPPCSRTLLPSRLCPARPRPPDHRRAHRPRPRPHVHRTSPLHPRPGSTATPTQAPSPPALPRQLPRPGQSAGEPPAIRHSTAVWLPPPLPPRPDPPLSSATGPS